jgi:hypothetical protein
MLLLAQNKRAAKLSRPFSQTAMQIHFHPPTHSLAGKIDPSSGVPAAIQFMQRRTTPASYLLHNLDAK